MLRIPGITLPPSYMGLSQSAKNFLTKTSESVHSAPCDKVLGKSEERIQRAEVALKALIQCKST